MSRGTVVVIGVGAIVGLIILLGSMFTVEQREQALVIQFGDPLRAVQEPGLNFKIPFIQQVVYFDKRLAPPSARADRERLINEAQAFRNRVLPEAHGQAAQLRAEAEAYKQQVVARAEGGAKRFVSVYDEYHLAEEVTKRRIYLETMEGVFRDMNKVIIDSSSQGTSGVIPYLPLPEIQKRVRAGQQ